MRTTTKAYEGNSMDDLLATYIFYSQFNLIIKDNPHSLIEQMRSRLFGYNSVEQQNGLNNLMNEAFQIGFMNNLRIEWTQKLGANRVRCLLNLNMTVYMA